MRMSLSGACMVPRSICARSFSVIRAWLLHRIPAKNTHWPKLTAINAAASRFGEIDNGKG